jgi:F-type H+-transporting ATPase subunit b
MIGLPNVTSLYALLAFGISYAILKKYLFVPLSGILEARANEERQAQKAHAESLQTLEKAVAAGEEQLSQARREALTAREAARGQGMALLEQKLAEARAAATAAVAAGSSQIEAQAAASARELPDRSRSLARELAEKILGRKLAA